MVGRSPDEMFSSSITDYLLKTTWQPKEDAFLALYSTGLPEKEKMNHTLQEIEEIYGKAILEGSSSKSNEVDEFTPLYWSAGLITHPKFFRRTRAFQRAKKMDNNKHLWPLANFLIPDGLFARQFDYYELFSSGQMYTDMDLSVFKDPREGLVLSSFELYNAHNCGFQQLPWIANVAGLPVWTQSGAGSESIAGFGIHNTHNPAVQQRRGLLLVSYVAPRLLTKTMIVGNIFSYHVRCFWPMQFFDEEEVISHEAICQLSQQESASQPNALPDNRRGDKLQNARAKQIEKMTWMIGRKCGAYIAVLCTAKCTWDTRSSNDAMLQPTRSDEKQCIPRRTTTSKAHSWVIVVGSASEFSTLDNFKRYKLSAIVCSDSNRDRRYQVTVTDSHTQESMNYSARSH